MKKGYCRTGVSATVPLVGWPIAPRRARGLADRVRLWQGMIMLWRIVTACDIGRPDD